MDANDGSGVLPLKMAGTDDSTTIKVRRCRLTL